MTELKALQARLAEIDLVGFAIAPEQAPAAAASKVGATKPPPAFTPVGTAGVKLGASKDGRAKVGLEKRTIKLGASKLGATKVGATKPGTVD